MKAQTRFKAVGSIAKLSTLFMNNNNINHNHNETDADDEEEEGSMLIENED